MSETEKLVQPKEVALDRKVELSTVHRWIKRGKFGKPKPNGGGLQRERVLIPLEMIDENPMSEIAKHPDIFTAEEAIEYLHLDPEKGKRTLQTLRSNGDLVGFKVGKGLSYHRKSLDACLDRLAGVPTGKKGR